MRYEYVLENKTFGSITVMYGIDSYNDADAIVNDNYYLSVSSEIKDNLDIDRINITNAIFNMTENSWIDFDVIYDQLIKNARKVNKETEEGLKDYDLFNDLSKALGRCKK